MTQQQEIGGMMHLDLHFTWRLIAEIAAGWMVVSLALIALLARYGKVSDELKERERLAESERRAQDAETSGQPMP